MPTCRLLSSRGILLVVTNNLFVLFSTKYLKRCQIKDSEVVETSSELLLPKVFVQWHNRKSTSISLLEISHKKMFF